jgi:hypothetical protein
MVREAVTMPVAIMRGVEQPRHRIAFVIFCYGVGCDDCTPRAQGATLAINGHVVKCCG